MSEPNPTPPVEAPLYGVRVVEMAGIGPGPHAAMLFADWGADVVRIERPDAPEDPDTMLRGRTVVRLDLKSAEGRDAALALLERADLLVEGFRPGVMERLGLGPDVLHERHPALVYGRVTGWGQDGPWSQMAGHDLNYLSATGILDLIGPAEAPAIPLNLVGDFGGGSMFLVSGMLAALVEARGTGRGRVVDAAMIDGVGQLAHMMWSMRSHGQWREQRASNLLDGGAPFYSVYRCADGAHVAVGCIEPQFYALMLEGLGLDASALPAQLDRARWPELRSVLAGAFATRTRDEWSAVFVGTDACVTPVLTMTEAIEHEQLAHRSALRHVGGAVHPTPAPRFARGSDAFVTAQVPGAATPADPALVLELWTRARTPDRHPFERTPS